MTGKDKKASPACDVVFVIYGTEDKTEEMKLEQKDGERFRPGATDTIEVRDQD